MDVLSGFGSDLVLVENGPTSFICMSLRDEGDCGGGRGQVIGVSSVSLELLRV